jgi:hypothetical protein
VYQFDSGLSQLFSQGRLATNPASETVDIVAAEGDVGGGVGVEVVRQWLRRWKMSFTSGKLAPRMALLLANGEGDELMSECSRSDRT